ncbi:MAG: hypothetical protein RBR86_01850 [Pseudobdellovibrionaceae bacterium]|nr:hypothetical protein [Pseudobdellovibrionaceae bacterium]
MDQIREIPHAEVPEDPADCFDVYAAFSQLDTARKMTLFDQLFGHRTNAYKNSMKTFWPRSTEEDARKLAMMLKSRMDRLRLMD